MKYTVGKQQRKLSLGVVVPGSLAAKRKIADEVLSRARLGEDTVAAKRAKQTAAARQMTTMGQLVEDYLADKQARPSFASSSLAPPSAIASAAETSACTHLMSPPGPALLPFGRYQ